MKRFAGTIIILLGIGLVGAPFIWDFLPVDFFISGNSHAYIRVVAEPAPSSCIPLILIGVGILTIAAGIFVRRRNSV